MPDLNALKAKYFIPAADLAPGEATFPYESSGNTVVTLVDGFNYFGALRAEVNALKAPGGSGKFFYFTNWLLELLRNLGGMTAGGSSAWEQNVDAVSPFRLDDGSGGVFMDFIDELAQLAANGTDVRALGWVNPLLLSYQKAAEAVPGVYMVNVNTALSIHALRQVPNMANKACLNTLAHPLGAMHLKMVVCGDATGARGYVSGIDFGQSRVDGNSHPASASHWHDAGIRIEGPGAMGVYGAFRNLWNEEIGLPADRFRVGDVKIDSYVAGTPSVPASPPFPAGGGGTVAVQVLRTLPAMRFAVGGTERAPLNCIKRLVSGFRREPLKSAPNGIFAFAASLQNAISKAERYIYVEDQGFWGHTIMDWLRVRLAAKPDLKLIMAYRADPGDGPNATRNVAVAINQHLASAGANMDDQVAFYARTDGVVMHSKLWIIDDEFMIIGSANAFRRSLYTDGELSIGVIDGSNTDANAVIGMRVKLWGEHCGLLTEADQAPLRDIDAAIKIWNPDWGGEDDAPATLKPVFQYKHVPFEVGPNADQWPALNLTINPTDYDQFDGDSRMEY